MTLREYQRQVRDLVPERFRYPRLLAVLALAEEVSEFLSECLRPPGDPARDAALTDELGDVLFSCAEIASEYGFDLDDPPDGSGVPDQGPNPERQLLELAAVAGRVSHSSLEIECLDLEDRSPVCRATLETAASVLRYARANGLDPQAGMRRSLDRIRRRIESGKWEARYGDRLLRKRAKFD